ncbi:uracil-DNA glycosylase family protein [Geomesophilobacter sediminis]|uniref:Uracil-DNA glycosylase family protein n=1 Tax=Geomesophilobacter sediminis TaxID=2798584 RepID=A0A8J7IMR4_9BACT|nr:uracil-DNA glycosylase family protein [Geomesophilobacter sediminis]MBJ6724158.1 uracil-DNA glycosylase family protein [Geomesophilobacter sediminis]
MKRFYELPDSERLARIHKRCWSIADAVDIGPVNTNIFADVPNIQMVIICESPSYAEVESGFPTVCSTGSRIFNNLINANIIDPKPLSLPNNYCFLTHYKLFASNGIYITNLVRFQADFAVKSNGAEKNARVKQAWNINKGFLFEELTLIRERFGETPVLLACGSAFESENIEVIQQLVAMGLPWFVTSHPSRCKNAFCDNYNPKKWSDPNVKKTSLAQKITKRFTNCGQQRP